MSTPTLPDELRSCLEHISDALERLANGDDATDDLVNVTGQAARVASELAAASERTSDSPAKVTTFHKALCANVKTLRNEAKITQAALAAAMTSIGFDWKRITCAEVETAKRRLTIEEVVGVAALFAVPAITLFHPHHDTAIAWHQGDLSGEEVSTLFVGPGGSVSGGGPTWRAARRALGKTPNARDERPADALWKHRTEDKRPAPAAQSDTRARSTNKGKT
jgi:hypothetical protein